MVDKTGCSQPNSSFYPLVRRRLQCQCFSFFKLNAQGSGHLKLRKPRGRVPIAEGCGGLA